MFINTTSDNYKLDTSSNNVKKKKKKKKRDVLGTLYKYRDVCTRCKIVFRTVLLCACHFCKAYDSRPIKPKIICINLKKIFKGEENTYTYIYVFGLS